MPETIASANAAASTLFLGHNGEWWDFWLIVAVGLAAFAGIAIGITTTGSVVSHKREALAAEVSLEAYKLTVEGKVADAKKEGIGAGKAAGDALLKVAVLEEQAEQLRKDTAEANARAAEAQLELEKFKAPRRLSAEQIARITAVAGRFRGMPFDIAVNPSPESQALAAQVSDLLEAAGWQWLMHDNVLIGITRRGKPTMGIETSFAGFAIEIHATKFAEWGDMLRAMSEAFAAEDIRPLVNVPTDHTANATAVHFIVGTKQ